MRHVVFPVEISRYFMVDLLMQERVLYLLTDRLADELTPENLF